MENTLKVLRELKSDLESSAYRFTFERKLEILAEFINSELDDSIGALIDGIERINELESELHEANEKIEELEREQS